MERYFCHINHVWRPSLSVPYILSMAPVGRGFIWNELLYKTNIFLSYDIIDMWHFDATHVW